MDTAAFAGRSARLLIAPLVVAGLAAAACSSSSPSQPSGTAAPGTGGAVTTAPVAAATENPPPGDIPDSTAFIPYRAATGQFLVKVPEGWAQTVTSSGVSLTDKLNTITMTVIHAPAPTPATARASEVPKIQSTERNFTLADISTVQRPAGSAVLIRYSAASQPDPVTGKVYPDDVERYEFYHNGLEAIITLSGPRGADNVDPWLTVTNSFQWLR